MPSDAVGFLRGAAAKYARLEASRSARVTGDVTTERRPMPRLGEDRKGARRLPSQGRVVDFPASFTLASKPWQVVKERDEAAPFDRAEYERLRIVLSAHGTQADAEVRAGEGRDALTDAEVGEGWNVVAERRQRGKR